MSEVPNIDDLFAPQEYTTDEQEVPCMAIMGSAGCGKTYEVVKRVTDDPGYGILTATTGIASVNLGAITLHSLLKFFDTQSARDSFLSGPLVKILHDLAGEYRWLIIDEVSMLDADLLDVLVRAVREGNRGAAQPMGILLVGDFAQLPPVRARWAFQAQSWPKFAANTQVLTKMWRQQDAQFLNALNLTRRGQGYAAAEVLTSAGAKWNTALHTEFDGTTILPKNDQVSRYNALALDRVPGQVFRVQSRRWGKQRPEWGFNTRTKEWGIPERAEFKVGAYVMLLANKPDGLGGFEYVNGDCGHINDYGVVGKDNDLEIHVKLVRDDREVTVRRIVRSVDTTSRPHPWDGPKLTKDDPEWLARPHQRGKRYVLGQVEYFPMRLAYASTIHKSQSLTLDRVQVDFRNAFVGSPGMLYVALSRCRSLEGLRLVGQPEVFAQRCQIDERIVPYL